ncbi:OLC1v1027707C3 [Oldenlandia corymbosa var. corymbosa]|uniref:OLC1v1027707C3 n=1 Tax=Oldenlandia corymbosa var. corymbosa TaxID=529605 RepID=A0AAV1CAL2_OLDCO|nr:OLC1v1027707C3 [Oldenlandia corymbosa var. corymbosa]
MQMESRKFEPRLLLKDKRFWIASFLIVWAAGLQISSEGKQDACHNQI